MRNYILSVLAAIFCFLPSSAPAATTLYFDVNGAAADFGITATGIYDWNDVSTGGFWTTDSAGVSPPGPWQQGSFSRITAKGATPVTITVGAEEQLTGMFNVTNGTNLTINGTGSLKMVGGAGQGGIINGGSNAVLTINVPITGGGDGTIVTPSNGGRIFLNGTSTYTGGTSLSSSTTLIFFNNDSAFGAGTMNVDLDSETAFVPFLAQGGTQTVSVTRTLSNNWVVPVKTLGAGINFAADPNTPLVLTGSWDLKNDLRLRNNGVDSSPLTISGVIGSSPNAVNGITLTANNSGRIILTGANTYTGSTVVSQGTTQATLEAVDGVGLPVNSTLTFDGGVYQPTTSSFTRSLSSVEWQATFNGGGFSARVNDLTVNINNNGSTVPWGDIFIDQGNAILGPLKFGSVSANKKTIWVNPIDLDRSGIPGGVIRTITVTAGAGGDSAEIQGVISNTTDGAALLKNGNGILTLSAANTYSGGTNVNAGTLQLGNVAALPTTGGLTLSGGTLSNISGALITVPNTTTLTANSTLGGSNDFKLTGDITNSGGNRTLTISNSGTTSFNGKIYLSEASATGQTLTMTASGGAVNVNGAISNFNGAGTACGFTKAGTGTVSLNNANTYTGTTNASAGTLALGVVGALPSGSALTLSGGTLSNASGALLTLPNTTTIAGNSTLGGANGFTLTGNITNFGGSRTLTISNSGTTNLNGNVFLSEGSTTGRTLTINATGGLVNVGGVISNFNGAGTAGGLTKDGNGTLTLTNTNTYTGATTVNQGALTLGGSGNIASTTKLILSGGTLGTGGNNQTMASAALRVTASSTIDMGQFGSNDTLHLADSSAETWAPSGLGALLRISNWTPTDQITQGDHIIFAGVGLTGSSSTGQLSQIHFTGYKGTAKLVSGELLPSSTTILLRGDLTGEGSFAANDLATLEQALTNVTAYETAHGFNDADFLDVADVNQDGQANNADIQGEIYLLINGQLPPTPGPAPSAGGGMHSSPVPEPASLVLMRWGAAMLLAAGTRKVKRMHGEP